MDLPCLEELYILHFCSHLFIEEGCTRITRAENLRVAVLHFSDANAVRLCSQSGLRCRIRVAVLVCNTKTECRCFPSEHVQFLKEDFAHVLIAGYI